MSAAHIVLEDTDGQIAMKVTFSGAQGQGFDRDSHAHQHAQILIKMMDELCTKAEAQPVAEPALIVQA